MADLPDTTRRSDPSPIVSVIIPARDEELSLGTCLRSLTAQGGDGSARGDAGGQFTTPCGLSYEIVVVDDGSSDSTAELARSFRGVRVVPADPLPPGCIGKCNACVTGTRHARGSWLLFTDADTVHKPGSLAGSLAEARAHNADLLTYSPEQYVSGLGQRAVMPLIFAELASTYKPSEVRDPTSSVAAANGQFLLITREAYDAAGGHAAVGNSLLEDVALARLVKASGRTIRFRYGGDLVGTRMYRTYEQMRDGWTKNLALLFPSAQKVAFYRALEFVGSAVMLTVAFVAGLRGWHGTALAASIVSIATLLKVFHRVRKAHFGTLCTMLSPFGLPLFSYLLLRSRISHKKGRVAWKGRDYLTSPPPSHTDARRRAKTSGVGHG